MQIKQLIARYRLPAFLVAVIGLAGVLVVVSISIYYSSGAFQLDLSRPEYQSVRSQIVPDQKEKDTLFSTQGEMTDEALNDFLGRYKKSADGLIELEAFSGDVLSDEQLGF